VKQLGYYKSAVAQEEFMKIRSGSRCAVLAAIMLVVASVHAQQGNLTCKAWFNGNLSDTNTLQLTLDESQGTAKTATAGGEWTAKAEFTDTKVTWYVPSALQGAAGVTYVFNRMTGGLTRLGPGDRPIEPSYKCEVARKVY